MTIRNTSSAILKPVEASDAFKRSYENCFNYTLKNPKTINNEKYLFFIYSYGYINSNPRTNIYVKELMSYPIQIDISINNMTDKTQSIKQV